MPFCELASKTAWAGARSPASELTGHLLGHKLCLNLSDFLCYLASYKVDKV